MNLCTTDFASYSRADQIRHFELEGFLVLPQVLDEAQVARIKQELADVSMRPATYAAAPTWSKTEPQWHSRACAELIAHPPIVDFLRALLGDDVVLVHGHFVRSQPGQPPMPLISNSAPYGSLTNGWRDSSPIMVRVLNYLDDTRLDRAPFRVVPRSHLSFHSDANPYLRYERHPEEIVVPARRGDALLFAPRVFHGTLSNTSEDVRELVEFTYRPRWARPVHPIEEWDPDLVASLPEQSRRFLRSRSESDRHPEEEPLPTPLPTIAPGIAPSRWGPDRLKVR